MESCCRTSLGISGSMVLLPPQVVFGGGEDKNHEPIMLPLALFFSLSLFHERQEAECLKL